MEALTLVLDKPNTVVTMKDRSLWINRENHDPLSVPLGCLDTVVVIGKPLVSCDVWRALAEANVAACLFPGRGNQLPAMLGVGLAAGTEKRRKQYSVYASTDTRLAVASAIVERKLAAYEDALLILDVTGSSSLALTPDSKENFCSQIEKARQRLIVTEDISTLLGIEGAAGRAWFSLLRKGVDEQWQFSGRNRRPPKDPLNTLMSLTYAMIGVKAQQVAHHAGLDPQLGFLHAPRAGRPALSLDIIEPVRPVADIFAIAMLGVMQQSDFYIDTQSGCCLNKSAKRRYFSAWSSQQHHWPSVEGQPVLEEETLRPDRSSLRSVLRQCVSAILRNIECQHVRLSNQHAATGVNDEYVA